MRLGAFGGPYANPHALKACLADARARGCDELVCLGDLGGFGAECDAIWPLLKGVRCIAGNYDIAIGRGDADCGCGYADARDNEFAQLMYDLTRAATSPRFAAWMRELPETLRFCREGCDVLCVHGSPLAVNDFLWESLSDDDLRLRLDAIAGGRPNVLLCTHTGIPWSRMVDETLIVNVGAVGRPANDGRTDTWYAVLELEDGLPRAQLVAVPYDWRAQAASMRDGGLPEPFAETIETGWWTTCLEIVPPLERSRGRYHVYRESLPAAPAGADAGWVDPVADEDDGRPVLGLFGTPLFPSRLWVYTNFHCNLACDYCVVASSPTARRRELAADRFIALVDEAVAEGFTELYITGGEPFVRADMTQLVEYACERLPTVVLTNAMLFTGRRRLELQRLARKPGLVLQSSLDGARAATHDGWRGAGSWQRAIDGIRFAASLGLPLRVAMTQTPDNREEVEPLRELLAGLGVSGDAFAVRPLVKRGFAADAQEGILVSDSVIVPELTVTADGLAWHPLGADRDASPDFVVASGDVGLAEGKRAVVQRFLELRLADGSLPAPFACAI
jgi:pyruvate-formate lyase-activating enzyme/diadenosine tetraphosphatase ApaH/serine/threonine PP2A family protein phosphatase